MTMQDNPIYLILLLIVGFLQGLLIAYVYKKTTREPSYSQSFVSSLVLLLPVVTLVIMFISNNIAWAIGVFGAFSIIRFRTPVKDAKDMFFIFWILATGLVLGVGAPLISVLSTVLISGMVYILFLSRFEAIGAEDYVLNIRYARGEQRIDKIRDKINDHVATVEVLYLNFRRDTEETVVTFRFSLRASEDLESVYDAISQFKDIQSFDINPAQFQLEY